MLSKPVLIGTLLWLAAHYASGQPYVESAALPSRLPVVPVTATNERIFSGPAPASPNVDGLSIGGRAPRQNAQRLTLADLQQLALHQHPSLLRAGFAVEAAQGNSLQVGRPPNPMFGVGEQQIGSDGRAEQDYVAVSQEFVRGGKLRLNRAVAAKETETAQLELVAQQRRLYSDVRIAFYTALVAQRQRAVAEEILDIARHGLKAAQEKLKGTLVNQNDVLEAQIELRTAEIQTRNTSNRQIAAWRSLTAIVGNPTLPWQELDGDLTLPSRERDWTETVARVEGNSPEMAIASAKVDRARLALRRASVENVPNVTVDALVNVRDNGIGGDPDGGLQVSIPLPVFNRNRGAIAKATAEVAMAEQDCERLSLELQYRLSSVFERYSNAYYQARLYRDEILPTAQKALGLTSQNYAAGEVDYDDLLTSQRTNAASNLAYLGSLLDLWVAEAELDGLLLTGSLEPR